MRVDLRLGDCLAILPTLPKESFDSIVTDPPYGIDYQSAWRTDRGQWKPKIANDLTPCIEWLPDAFRLTKQEGALLCFCRWDVQETFRAAIESAGFVVKSQVIWDRGNHGMGDLSGSFAPQHDVIWFATKGDFTFPGKRPSTIIRGMRLAADKLVHPNEKPVSLMLQLVASITPKGGTVLDCFMGVGATGVATIRRNCDFVGVEINESYFTIAKKRIEQAQAQLTMPLGDSCE